MADIRYTLALGDDDVRSVRVSADDVDFNVRVYDGSKTLGVVHLSIHFPGAGKAPEITIVKTNGVKWLDIMDGGEPCWPPVKREVKE